MNAVLAVKGLSKHYGRGAGRVEALQEVSTEIRAGESVAIVGKSGSGKSTLMHLLALLDEPDAGELFVFGRSTRKLSSRQANSLRNDKFGFVFQQFFLTPNASVLENIMLPLTIAGVSARTSRVRARTALAQLGLEGKAHSKAVELSGGQKQRVAIARALVDNPEVLFADEPTGNLDSTNGRLVEDILFSLNREKGITLVIVTHDPTLANRCDRQIVIHDGTIGAVEPARDTE